MEERKTTYFQPRWKMALLLVLVGFLSLVTSCSTEDNAVISGPQLKGVISSYNLYDGYYTRSGELLFLAVVHVLHYLETTYNYAEKQYPFVSVCQRSTSRRQSESLV